MSEFSREVAVSEIIEWWEESRELVAQRCREAEEDLAALADSRIGEMSALELLDPLSGKLRSLRAELETRLRDHAEALTRELDVILEESLRDTVLSLESDGIDTSSAVLLGASGATAIGAAGLAVGAPSLATTTVVSTSFFFFSAAITTFSWPVFAAAVGGAVTMALVSKTAASRALEWRRKRIAGNVRKAIHSRVSSLDPDARPESLRRSLNRQIEDILTQRIEGLPD